MTRSPQKKTTYTLLRNTKGHTNAINCENQQMDFNKVTPIRTTRAIATSPSALVHSITHVVWDALRRSSETSGPAHNHIHPQLVCSLIK